MMLDSDILDYVECLVRMARDGDTEAMTEVLRFKKFPVVRELIDEWLEDIEGGMDPRKAFPRRKVSSLERMIRDFGIAVHVEREKYRGMNELAAVISVAEAREVPEGTVKAAHQTYRKAAKEFVRRPST